MNTTDTPQIKQAEVSMEDITKALEEARQEASENRDKYLRVLADQENYRKRLQRVYEDRLSEYKRRFLRELLSVADNLERAMAYAQANDPLADGVRITYKQLQGILAEQGVQPMETVGQPFDPVFHEAVEMVKGEGEQNMVESELRKGYLYQSELLRPAQVRIVRSSS